MAGETPITLIGNLTADPELRFTPSGAAVANFTVASTPRTFDRQTNEWRGRVAAEGDARHRLRSPQVAQLRDP
jgi:single-stranded DNA-binding protein